MGNPQLKAGLPEEAASGSGSGLVGASVSFAPQVLLKGLLVTVAVLVSLGIAAHVLRFGFGFETALGFITLFDLNGEANIPTWFTSALMASCSLSLGLIALAKRAEKDSWVTHWAVLGALFMLMSVDEIVQVHERFMHLIHHFVQTGGLLTNAWVILAFVLLPVLGAYYFRFLLALPRRACVLFVISGTVYVSGVVGVEMISGLMKSEYGFGSLAFAISSTVEESLELIGLSLFAWSLADYVMREKLVWKFSVSTFE